MKITVVSLTSTTTTTATTTVNLEPDSTINDLKTHLYKTHHPKIPTHQQLLLIPTLSTSDHNNDHFSSPYGPLLPLRGLDSRPLAQCSITDGCTIYLTILVRVIVPSHNGSSHDTNEVLVELKWRSNIGYLRDQVKSITKKSVKDHNVTWGSVKFGPYQNSIIESLCDVWNNAHEPFVIVPLVGRVEKKAITLDVDEGQVDTDSEDERAKESDFSYPGAMFCSEFRRKYIDIGPLRDKRRCGSFFGVDYKMVEVRGLVNGIDPPGGIIPMPEAISGMGFVKDLDIKFVILWLGGGLEEMLTRFDFHKKGNTRYVVVKGERDLSTYCFLRKIKAEFKNIPICAVTDCDPCSVKVLAFLRYPLSDFPARLQRQFGAKWKDQTAVYGAKIEIKWIGVRPSYNRFSQLQTFPMDRKNVECAEELLSDNSFVGMFPDLVEELKLMVERQEMAKIEAFAGFGDEYFSSVFLPEELGKHRCTGVKSKSGRR